MTDPLLRLDDYVRGHMPDDEAADFEEDLFARALAGGAPELALRGGMERTFRAMRKVGTLEPWLTRREVDDLVRSGVRVLQVELDAAPPEVVGDVDMVVTRVPLDLTGLTKVDGEILTPDGRLLKWMPDARFDPADGAVYVACEVELAEISRSVPSVTRVWGTDEDGARRLIATLSLPGL